MAVWWPLWPVYQYKPIESRVDNEPGLWTGQMVLFLLLADIHEIIFAPLGSSFRRKLKLPQDKKTELQHEQTSYIIIQTNFHAVTTVVLILIYFHSMIQK